MNRSIFPLVVWFCCLFIPYQILKTDCQKILFLNPKTTVIACDLDEVIISGREQNYMHWLMAPSRWSFALTVRKVRKKYKIYDPLLIIDKIQQLYPKLSKKSDEFKKVLGTARPKKKTVELLQSVAKQGFTFLAASNMAKGTYKLLLNNKILPAQLFSSDIYFVKTKKCNKKADGSYYKKPNAAYYTNLRSYISKKFPEKLIENIVFIDDKKENVKAARKAGFIAIHYKNSYKLKCRLQQLGITGI